MPIWPKIHKSRKKIPPKFSSYTVHVYLKIVYEIKQKQLASKLYLDMHLDQLSGALLAIFADLLSGYCNLGQTTQTKALVIIQAPTTAHCPCCQGMLVTVLLAFQFIWAIQMPVPGRRRPRSEDSKAQARIILILLRRFIVF